MNTETIYILKDHYNILSLDNNLSKNDKNKVFKLLSEIQKGNNHSQIQLEKLLGIKRKNITILYDYLVSINILIKNSFYSKRQNIPQIYTFNEFREPISDLCKKGIKFKTELVSYEYKYTTRTRKLKIDIMPQPIIVIDTLAKASIESVLEVIKSIENDIDMDYEDEDEFCDMEKFNKTNK